MTYVTIEKKKSVATFISNTFSVFLSMIEYRMLFLGFFCVSFSADVNWAKINFNK